MKQSRNELLIFFLFFFASLASCKSKDLNSSSAFKIKVNVSLGGNYLLDKNEVVVFVGKIQNISEKEISFLSMTCSNEDTWRTTSNDIELGLKLCFSNVPTVIKLKPKESITYYLDAKMNKSIQGTENKKFLMGFNFIEADTADFDKAIYAIKNTKNIIWSEDTLQLKNLFWLNTIRLEKN